MSWGMAAKLAVQAIFSEKGRNLLLIIIGVFVAIALCTVSIISLPAMLMNLPQTAFQPKEQADKITEDYVNIMVEYKSKIHEKIASEKRKYISEGKTVDKVRINYPSLSMIIAYDNVLNKSGYKEAKIKVIIDKNKVFSFLDSCMKYNLEGTTMVSNIKTSEEIAKLNFSSQEDRNMFISIYDTLMKTDLDNTVPEVKFSDLEYLEGGIELPYINQYDERWINSPYGSSTVGKSGCAIASMCMVINGLVEDSNMLPPELARWSNSKGCYVNGVGTDWSIFPQIAEKYNFDMKILSRDNPQAILNELSKGHPVVVSMSAGHFTTGGHFMVLRGVTPKGEIIISDPASYENSKQVWDYSIILTESSALSSACFWSFTNK